MAELVCCVCWYTETGATAATTVIRGYAVCGSHMGLVAQGMEWAAIIQAAKGDLTKGSNDG